MENILASTYTLNHTDENGTIHKIELTGEEAITTPCPECGREHSMTFEDFLEVMKDGELYGTHVFCSMCSKKRAAHSGQQLTPALSLHKGALQ